MESHKKSRQFLAGGFETCRALLGWTAEVGGLHKTLNTSVRVQQDSFCLFRIHRTVKELVVFEEDLNERGARGNRALDQRLRQRVFDVLLQCASQRTSSVAAVGQSLAEDPLLCVVRNRDRDRLLC